MADKLDKWSDNVRGKFFVDEQCIDCDLCVEICPIEVLETHAEE